MVKTVTNARARSSLGNRVTAVVRVWVWVRALLCHVPRQGAMQTELRERREKEKKRMRFLLQEE
jgi:hypothetical protein